MAASASGGGWNDLAGVGLGAEEAMDDEMQINNKVRTNENRSRRRFAHAAAQTTDSGHRLILHFPFFFFFSLFPFFCLCCPVPLSHLSARFSLLAARWSRFVRSSEQHGRVRSERRSGPLGAAVEPRQGEAHQDLFGRAWTGGQGRADVSGEEGQRTRTRTVAAKPGRTWNQQQTHTPLRTVLFSL